MSQRFFGATVRRREDPRLVTGRGRYVGDVALPGLLHVAIARSPHAHARIRAIDASEARRRAGVVRVLTIGIDLPRVSRAMADEGTRVANRDALAEGDLVFFGKRGRIDHVGIYIGDGKFLHAPRTGRDVTVSSLTSGYWSQKYLEARRLATGS